jgi:hypothetical protein
MALFGRWVVPALLSLAVTAPAGAVTVGQVDDFEDGTTQGWVVAFGPGGGSHPAPPQNIATGGPAGVDDNFLMLTALGGGGPASRLTAGNLAQWSGDYLAAGVDRIEMWVNNFGQNDLFLRLLLEDPTGGPPANVAYSADPIIVAAGGGWQSISYSLAEADLVAALGDVNAALSGVTVLRVFHGVADGFPGEAVSAQLGVDNIRAVAAVPEPATWALMIGGFGLVGAALRRRVPASA